VTEPFRFYKPELWPTVAIGTCKLESLSNVVTIKAEVCCRANKKLHSISNVVTAGGLVALAKAGPPAEASPASLLQLSQSNYKSSCARERANIHWQRIACTRSCYTYLTSAEGQKVECFSLAQIIISYLL
jgi:hypothetical protein